MKNKCIPVYRAKGYIEARIIDGYLASHAIGARLERDRRGVQILALSAVDILVSNEDEQKARVLIAQYEKGKTKEKSISWINWMMGSFLAVFLVLLVIATVQSYY